MLEQSSTDKNGMRRCNNEKQSSDDPYESKSDAIKSKQQKASNKSSILSSSVSIYLALFHH